MINYDSEVQNELQMNWNDSSFESCICIILTPVVVLSYSKFRYQRVETAKRSMRLSKYKLQVEYNYSKME